jgi:hypothetical protein
LVEVDFSDGSSIQYFYDANGNLIAKIPGNQAYTIMASAGPGGTISPASWVTVASGGSQTFSITPNPDWYIVNVVVDGASVGQVTSYNFTNVVHEHTIQAMFAPYSADTYTITTSVSGSGSIEPGSAQVGYRGTQNFVIIPDAGNGYHVSNVVVDGNPVGAVSAYTFSNVTGPHTIQAAFSNTYTITTSAGAGGSISPPSANLTYGGSQTFQISPNPGDSILNVQVDGVSLGAISAYTFSDVSSNHNLSATFVQTPVMNANTGLLYQDLQSAYEAARTGDTILVQSVQLVQNFVADQNISVIISGGYTSDFRSNPGMTTIKGVQAINNGTVTWGNFIVSN